MNGKQLKNSILQWAIQGKLVPQDPNDEPASVLLERIREEKARLVKEKKIKKDKNESIIFRGDDNSHYEKFADGTVKCIDDEIPFEIPQSWCWTRICNITQSYIGLTYSPSDVSSQGTIVLRSSNIKNGRLDLCDIVRVSKEIPEKLKVAPNDIIICARNGSKRLVGKSAIVDTVNEPMTFGAFMAICKTPLYKYIYQFLQSDLFFSQLRDVSGTTTINQLTQNNFNAFLVPIPPIEEQQRIVERIEEIMPIADKYEKSQEALDKLNADIFDKLKKSVLQEAIQGKLVPQNPNDEPASVLLERIRAEKTKLFKEGKLKKKDLVDSVIFKGDDNKYYETIDGVTECIEEEIPYDLPLNWDWTRLGNVAKMTIGKTPARGDQRFWSNGEYSWVSISDMKDLGVISATKERISAIAVKELMGNISPKGSLLMSFKLTVGRTSLLDVDAYHNEAIITVLPFIDECNTFRNYLFRTLPLLSVAGDSKDAIKGKTLNSQSLSRLLIPLAPLGEQERIVQELQRVSSIITS